MIKLIHKEAKNDSSSANKPYYENMLKILPVHDWALDEEGYFIIKLLEYVLTSVSNHSVQRILREVVNDDLSIVMKGLSTEARGAILRNLSTRLGTMICENMEFMGEVTSKQVGEKAQDIMTIIVKLMSLNVLPDNEYGIISRLTKIFGVKDKNLSLEAEEEIESELETLFKNYRKVKNGVIE